MRIIRPYWTWECWINGMYRKLKKEIEPTYIATTVNLMSDGNYFSECMGLVINEWANTMLHNMTNKSINRLAFLGQCSCCYSIGTPEYITRIAWKELTTYQRFLANKEAEKTINKWFKSQYGQEKENIGIRKDTGKQLLFTWDT